MKALRCGIDQIKGLSCGSTFIIYQPFLKSAYLLHKKGFVDSQMVATVALGVNCWKRQSASYLTFLKIRFVQFSRDSEIYCKKLSVKRVNISSLQIVKLFN